MALIHNSCPRDRGQCIQNLPFLDLRLINLIRLVSLKITHTVSRLPLAVTLHHTGTGKYTHKIFVCCICPPTASTLHWNIYTTLYDFVCLCALFTHVASACECVCVQLLTLGSQQKPASVVEPSNGCPAGVRHTQGQPRSQPLPLRTLSSGRALQPAVCPRCMCVWVCVLVCGRVSVCVFNCICASAYKLYFCV